MILKVPNTSIEVQVVGKRLNRGGSYGLEIPVIYRFYGQEKLVNWLIKKIEAVKRSLNAKFLDGWNKYLENRSILSFFSILLYKNFGLSANWREKKAKLTILCRK